MSGVLVPRAAADLPSRTGLPLPGLLPVTFSARVPAAVTSPLSRPSFCEVEVNHTLIVPEFDPELQPIGYTLALEFLGEGGYADSSEERVLTTSAHVVDRFG